VIEVQAKNLLSYLIYFVNPGALRKHQTYFLNYGLYSFVYLFKASVVA